MANHGDVGAIAFPDGSISAWTALGAYDAAYNGVLHGMARTKKRIGVTSTIVFEKTADGGLASTKRMEK